ncbi:MAG: hypothetical protein ABIK91_05400 [Pseudomonadota bacterium]|nr:hypothetical protein [Pseudomonadota bacterium]
MWKENAARRKARAVPVNGAAEMAGAHLAYHFLPVSDTEHQGKIIQTANTKFHHQSPAKFNDFGMKAAKWGMLIFCSCHMQLPSCTKQQLYFGKGKRFQTVLNNRNVKTFLYFCKI